LHADDFKIQLILEPMMDLQLSGKRALVTGSSSGVGEAMHACLPLRA
jgi:hypothetical protein